MYLLTGFLGIVSLLAPFLLGYNADMAAMWTSLAVGAVLLVAAVFEGYARGKEKWEYYLAGIVGLGAIIAPFVLGFSMLSAAFWTLVIVGVVAILTAGMGLFPGQTEYR